MECFKRFRHIDSHFASKQILKGFERSNHRKDKRNDFRCGSDSCFVIRQFANHSSSLLLFLTSGKLKRLA